MSMNNEIIKSIEINIGDTTVKVSPKQARELFAALADLLGEPRQNVTILPNITYPVYPAIQPLHPWPTITYGTGDCPALSDGSITIQ